ncbi:C45 family autoproteolytic acyltransferase/hydrolase [bacterium]|nr:C45 family autoproteolytic acyltransferase/hydrolase [bacterium]
MIPRRPLLVSLTLLAACAVANAQWEETTPQRYRCNGYRVLRLVGTPEEMGRQHGRLLGSQVRRVVRDVIGGEAGDPERHARLIAGTKRMERQLPSDIREELHALAGTARVDYWDLVALQLFGDVWRASQCSSFAVYGRATATGELVAGRNFDFWDHGVSEYAAVIIHYVPETGIPFFTVTWAGIINGWTAMNTKGVLAANNTSWGRSDSLDGLSTCFMIRKIVQHASTVQEGVDIIQNTPRACGTNMLVAGGSPPAAAVVEYDHEQVAVRWAKPGDAPLPELPPRSQQAPPAADQPAALNLRDDTANGAADTAPFDNTWLEPEGNYDYVSGLPGVVIATNHFRALYQDEPQGGWVSWCGRYRKLERLIGENYGRTDRTMNFIGQPGVGMGSINLHSVLLFPADLTFRVSMGRAPAYEYPFRSFRLTPTAIVSAEDD